MNRSVLVITFRLTASPEEIRSWLADANALSGLPEVTGSSASENLPGSVGGGDAVWDLRTQDSLSGIPAVSELMSAACAASTETLALNTIASGHRDLPGARIKRTLALTVRAGTSEPQMQRFERSLQAMPDHIPEISSWSLSRVRPEASNSRWTHVWEQEFADVAGLRVAYMRSPYHWTGVDRWFDPEVPCSIVEPRLAHMFGWTDRPVLTA
jgi:Stress responsive A/B Barrel Domain